MKITSEYIAHNFKRTYITDYELELLLGGTAESRYSKVKRLIANKQLIHIRRGLYCIGENINYPLKPHPFELAQQIYAPSMVSLESALSFHKLIPEAVYVTTSVCVKRAKTFNTPLGVFSYQHLPLENFYTEMEIISDNNYRYFMAKPWRAICDYIFCYKKDRQSLSSLIDSLRIDIDALPILRNEEAAMLEEYYGQRRVSQFLKSVKQAQQMHN